MVLKGLLANGSLTSSQNRGLEYYKEVQLQRALVVAQDPAWRHEPFAETLL